MVLREMLSWERRVFPRDVVFETVVVLRERCCLVRDAVFREMWS